MDLIDRYLDAVRLFLPRDQRDDIAAELRDVLLTRREEREAVLGRPLTRKEDEALLHDYGHPLIVAARYRPAQYLIGPELYPIYAFVLIIVLAAIGVAAAITGVVTVSVAGGDIAKGVGAALNVAWTGGFAAVGAVTVIFAILQRTGASQRIALDWSIRDLPRITRRRPRQPWFEHAAGLVFQIVFLFWWVGLIRLGAPAIPLHTGGALHFAFAPALQGLYLPVLALAAGAIAVHALMLAGRDVRSVALALDALLQAALAGVAGLALSAGHWVLVTGAGIDPLALAKVDQGVNIGAEVTLIVVIVGALIRMGASIWRLTRRDPA
ncbi:MAG TPA: hypothetical protein VN814_03250 [Caulobacteraceae bacterium]|nr:hypothetical protein [Caulobacteraceae bacterium]